MDRVSRKDLTRKLTKYLIPGTFILTNHGFDEFEVDIKSITNRVQTKVEPKKFITDHLISKAKLGLQKIEDKKLSLKADNIIDKYGCGCKKIDGQLMCPKHSRY